jgi:hypothetical protein
VHAQYNIFLALPPSVPPRILRHLNRHKIEISTIHRSARKTGSSELWRNLHVKIRSAAFGSKYPISYQNFRIWNMPTFDQLDSFSNFYFAHDESLKPFFLHQIYRKLIQQCLQTIKLFRNVPKTFFTLVFSALFCINIPILFLLTL